MASGGHYRAHGQGQGDELGSHSVSESESALGSLEQQVPSPAVKTSFCTLEGQPGGVPGIASPLWRPLRPSEGGLAHGDRMPPPPLGMSLGPCPAAVLPPSGLPLLQAPGLAITEFVLTIDSEQGSSPPRHTLTLNLPPSLLLLSL